MPLVSLRSGGRSRKDEEPNVASGWNEAGGWNERESLRPVQSTPWELKTNMLQPLAILASGLAIAAAIYLKPLNPPEKFATVALDETMFAIVENGVTQVCIISPDREGATKKGVQFAFMPLCGDRYATDR
jgi:hypothetical protein